MIEEYKKEWVSALRSGQYKQITDNLCTDDGFCCLGVLCEINMDRFDMNKGSSYNNTYSYHMNGESEDTILPKALCLELGLPKNNPEVYINGNLTTVAMLNDRYWFTFNEIADVIENDFKLPPHLVEKINNQENT